MRVRFYSFMIRGSTPGRRKGELLIEQFSFLRDVKDKLIPFGFLLRRAWQTASSATVASIVISLCANQPPANNTGQTHQARPHHEQAGGFWNWTARQ